MGQYKAAERLKLSDLQVGVKRRPHFRLAAPWVRRARSKGREDSSALGSVVSTAHPPGRRDGRGRNGPYGPPPAQIPIVRNYRNGLLPRVRRAVAAQAWRVPTLLRLPYPIQLTLQVTPALCPEPGLLDRVPLGRPPSLHGLRLRWRTTDLVRPLPRYYEAVRLPTSVHRCRAPVGSQRGPRRLPRGRSWDLPVPV